MVHAVRNNRARTGQRVARKWVMTTIGENKRERRSDIVLFVNGLPLAVIELKNSADEIATMRSGLRQLQTYKAEIAVNSMTLAVLEPSEAFGNRKRRVQGRFRH